MSIDPAYKQAVLSSRVVQARKKRADRRIVSEFRTREEDYYGIAFIAGYTAGGAPYGITNEEMESEAYIEFRYERQPDDDIPF